MNVDTCTLCQRPIRSKSNRFIIHARHVVCAMCVFNDKSPERLRQMHDLAAPDCAVDWHDHWDHFERFTEGPRAAVMSLLGSTASLEVTP